MLPAPLKGRPVGLILPSYHCERSGLSAPDLSPIVAGGISISPKASHVGSEKRSRCGLGGMFLRAGAGGWSWIGCAGGSSVSSQSLTSFTV